MITEQLFFSSSFCTIFWFKIIRGIFRGIGMSNELISRDEGEHYRNGLYIYKVLKLEGFTIAPDRIINIICQATDIEKKIASKITPTVEGMNKNLMCQYIEYMADKIMSDIGEKKIYNSTNPFPFMDQFGIEKKIDGFHRKSTSYTNYVEEEFKLN